MTIIRQLFEIILNKRSPADIDYNINAAIICCTGDLFFYFSFLSLFNEFSEPFIYAAIITGSYVLAYSVLLKVHGKENRLVQTLTALFGTSLILYTIALAFIATQIFAVFSLGIWMFSIVVFVRVIKSSFSCPTYLAIVILISSYVFSNIMLSIVCPNSSQEAQLMMENMQQRLEQEQASNQ